TDDLAKDFIGPLYDYALQFVLNNADLLGDDPQMQYLAIIAIRGAGSTDYANSIDTLWNLTDKYHDPAVQTEIIKSLGALGKDNASALDYLNQYLTLQNSLRFSRFTVDYSSISACIEALADLGDSSSFLPVFNAVTASYTPDITREAVAALQKLQGDFRQFLLDIINNNPPKDKFTAFTVARDIQGFSTAEQAEFACAAMEQGLNYQAGNIEENNILNSLRYEAALELTRLQWTQASDLVIRHFYRVQNDFYRSYATKDRYLEAINCLGAMGTSEAAVQAALQLAIINAQTEKSGTYDEAVTLALIGVLGLIGDKSASDSLLVIAYLPYSDDVKSAAQEALNRLRW
ncbi:MAG: hypothetical protein FWF29_02100, partial [Treponema sp.]|nr:hypothetical protein [Treponema sp.]